MRRMAASIAIATLLLAGCAGDDGDAAGDATTPPADETTPAQAEPTADATTGAPDGGAGDGRPQVELLDAGAEPRYPMRIDPEEGQETTLEMRMDTQLDLTVDGQPQPTGAIPTMVMTMHALVDTVTDDTVSTVVTYQDARAEGDDTAELQAVLDTVVGLSGTVTTTRTGAFVEGSIAPSGDVDPSIAQLLQSMDQQLASLAVPMPEEDLGVGARWTTTMSLDVGVAMVETVATYTLDAFDGTAYALDVEIDQQYVPGTGQPGVQLVEGSGSGSGTSAGSLQFPFAVEGTVTNEGLVVFEVTQGGATQRVEQRQQLQMEMRPVS